MKLVLLSVLMTLFALPSFAQSWMTDYDEAMAQAIQEDKHVLLFFTGSDWCPPCKRIKKDIYTSEKFVTYADEKLVLLVADFPRKRANKLSDKQEAKNRKLAAEYGIDAEAGNTLVLIQDDECYVCSDAVLAIAAGLTRPWRVLRILKAVPRPLRDGLYRFIARNRYRWFGRRRACFRPDEAVLDRFPG